ncbi:hypothetical protein HWV62_20268 [Athelia sp. TMB]|nr:hypothetical protein HWV62_20268 [Athelia sp. TMB]
MDTPRPHTPNTGSATVAHDYPLIDWSHFEPNSVQLYNGSGSDWIMGRALWKPSTTAAIRARESSASSSLPIGGTEPQGLHEYESDSGSGRVLKPTKSGYLRPNQPARTPSSTFKPISKPIHSHVFPLPGRDADDVSRQVGFFIADASDPEKQTRLMREIEGMEVMHSAGLPVLPRAATWTDKYGNLCTILHLPPQGITTFREMYIFPFANGGGTTPPTLFPNTQEVHALPGIVSLLDQVLEHTIQMVAVIESMHECGFIIRCGRTDSWCYVPPSAALPNGLVVLANAAGIIQQDVDAHGENSIARVLLSGHQETEKWMVLTHAEYLAPEVLRRVSVPVDARSDIFSVGCVLYEILTGHTPAQGDDFLSRVHQILAVVPRPVSDLVPGVPEELSRIISKCLEKSPQDRYNNANSLRYDLEQLADALRHRGTSLNGPLIEVGAMDEYSRFRLSDDLIGLEDCKLVMKGALEDAKMNQLSAVSISGSSGTGKTALACSLRGEVESGGGRFCVGKACDSISVLPPVSNLKFQYDSTSYNSPLAPFWQIINQLASPLLSLSEGELEGWRIRIKETVGSTLVQFVEVCLDPDVRVALRLRQSPESSPPPNTEGTSLPSSYKEAFYGALSRFLSLFIAKIDGSKVPCTQRPLVLFIDDVQWGSADDVIFFSHLLATDRLSGCMLIFAFRDNDGSKAFLDSGLRRRLCELPYALQTKLLERQDIYFMLQEMFKQGEHTAEDDIGSLATFLHSQSLGNAQQCRLLLRNLHQTRMIRFDWSTCRWKWDRLRIGNHSTTDSALEFWESILAGRSTSHLRKTVFAAAAISAGGAFSLQLLAYVTEQPTKDVAKLIETFAQEAKVFSHVKTNVASHSPSATLTDVDISEAFEPDFSLPPDMQQWLDADLWTFTHDQVQQAAKELLPISQRAAMHSQIGTALLTLADRNESMLQCILRVAAGPAALRHLEDANKLLKDQGIDIWQCDFSTAFNLAQAFVRCYTLTAQYREAVELAKSLQHRCKTDLDRLTVADWQARALTNYDAQAALKLGLSTLSNICGITIGSTPIEDIRMRASFGDASVEQILALIPSQPPPEVAARAAILSSLITLTFSSAPEIAEEIVLQGAIAAREGFTEHAPITLSVFALFKHSTMREGSEEAKTLDIVAGHLAKRVSSPYVRLGARMGLACTAHHNGTAPQDILATYAQISADAANLAHWEFLNYAMGYGYYAQLMGGLNLVPAFDASWLTILEGRVAPASLNFTIIGERSLAILKGTVPLEDKSPFIRLPVPLASEETLVRVQYVTCEALHCSIFRRPDPTLLDQLIALKGKTPGIMHEAYYPFHIARLIYELAAVGLLENPTANIPVAEKARLTLGKVPALRLIDANRLEYLQDFPGSFSILEKTLKTESANGPTLLLAMTYEQAANLVKKWTKSDFLSATFVTGALQTYKDVGALAKCAHMESALYAAEETLVSVPSPFTFPTTQRVARSIGSGSDSSGSDPVSASDSVDLATLLSAVSTWQRETSASRVGASLIGTLMKSMGARYGALALVSKDGVSRLSVAGTLENLRSDLLVAVDDCGDLAPSSLLNYAIRTRKTVVDLAGMGVHTTLDPFFATHRPRSVFVLPVVEEGSLRGVCYLDSARDCAFSKTSLELVGLLTTGAAVAIERVYLLNELDAQTKSLEHTVRVRTAAAEAAAAKAEQASLAQARFLQTMSHEMRTPLNSVVVLSDLLLEAQLDPVLYEYVSTIKASSNDLLAVIRDVLDFSRLESKNIALEKLDFDLVELVDDKLSFAMNMGNYPPLLQGDSTRVKQCLNNFLSNALKFTDANGSVTVNVTTESLISPDNSSIKIRIDVSDTGMGIPASKLPLLFKKFSQLDNSTTRLFGGSGLGLAIVRELSHLMGGDAWCESDFGRGSTFHFSFEAGICPPSATQVQQTTLAPETFLGRTVAIEGLRCETKKALVSNLAWLGFKVLGGEVDGNFSVYRDAEPNSIDLAILPFDAGSTLPEDIVSMLSAHQVDVRFIFISTQRQTAAQIARMAKFTCPVEFLATPLKTRTLSNALTRLFEKKINPIYTQVQRTSKRPKALPKLAEQILGHLGYTDFDVCIDGEEAVSMSRKRQYDLVLMDLQMPKLDGTSAMQIIRGEQPAPRGPAIVALTASAMSGDKEKALTDGFQDYVSKPIIITSFIKCLERVYDIRKSNALVSINDN